MLFTIATYRMNRPWADSVKFFENAALPKRALPKRAMKLKLLQNVTLFSTYENNDMTGMKVMVM